MTIDALPPEHLAEFDALLRAAVDCALAAADFAPALENFRAALPRSAPRLVAGMAPDDGRAFAHSLFRAIWNRLPRPDRDWKPLPLPKPERNGVCPCGSGDKYKQCCGRIDAAMTLDAGDVSVLAYVLETVPVERYSELPFKRFDPEELAEIAERWLDDGGAAAAVALLEPLLAPEANLDARHEYAFDVLCDAYLELGATAPRRALAERLMRAPDPDLKSAATHRCCTLLADAGDRPAAWRLFAESQRQDPDNPALAHLEVTLLAGQGEMERAQECAARWAKRLRRLGYGGEDFVAHLDEIARDPEALRAMMGEDAESVAAPEDVDALVDLAENLPAPAAHYRLEPLEGEAGPLVADAALADLEAEWDDMFWGGADERDPWADTAWIDWLRGHPLAWQCFAVLEDVVSSLDDTQFPAGDEDRIDWLEETLLDHAVVLLRANLAANAAENRALPWGWHENRPALRLLTRLADIAAGSDEELPLLEWLVLSLNPDDNFGHRVALVHRLCAAGRAADALAVCARYPDDALAGMRYGRVLALRLLERRGDATAALAAAKQGAPRVLKTLLARNPKAPEIRPGLVDVGGEDEAWLYRQDWLPVWEKTGALAWLREMSGGK